MPGRAPEGKEAVTPADLERRRAKVRDILRRVDARYGSQLPAKIDRGYERLHLESEAIDRQLGTRP